MLVPQAIPGTNEHADSAASPAVDSIAGAFELAARLVSISGDKDDFVFPPSKPRSRLLRWPRKGAYETGVLMMHTIT